MNQTLLKEFIESNDILEPETIRQVFPGISEEEFNETMALKLLRHTKHFFENFYAFEDMVLALNGIPPNFETVEGCTPEQIFYAVELADKLRPGLEYSKEVQLYIKFMCNDVGVFLYPQSIGLDNPYYKEAKRISIEGPFPIDESTTEEIQAGKLLAIKEYLNEKMRQM